VSPVRSTCAVRSLTRQRRASFQQGWRGCGDLHERFADPVDVADACLGFEQSVRGEIFTEGSRLKIQGGQVFPANGRSVRWDKRTRLCRCRHARGDRRIHRHAGLHKPASMGLPTALCGILCARLCPTTHCCRWVRSARAAASCRERRRGLIVMGEVWSALRSADLLNDGGEPAAGRSERILHPRGQPRVFGPRDEAIVQQFPEPFIEDLRRNSGDEALQLARSPHTAMNRADHARTPFAADHVFEAVVLGPFTERLKAGAS